MMTNSRRLYWKRNHQQEDFWANQGRICTIKSRQICRKTEMISSNRVVRLEPLFLMPRKFLVKIWLLCTIQSMMRVPGLFSWLFQIRGQTIAKRWDRVKGLCLTMKGYLRKTVGFTFCRKRFLIWHIDLKLSQIRCTSLETTYED